jgi:hypothetical protein
MTFNFAIPTLQVWSHLDNGECLGEAVGVRTRLDNSLTGFISTGKLSDSKVTNPEDRVKVTSSAIGYYAFVFALETSVSGIDVDMELDRNASFQCCPLSNSFVGCQYVSQLPCHEFCFSITH